MYDAHLSKNGFGWKPFRLQRKLQFNFFFFTAQKSIFAVAAVNDQVIRGQKLYHLYNSINGLKRIARLFLHTQCIKCRNLV